MMLPHILLLLVIKVAFLPPNTTSLIKPMDQGVIAAFKGLLPEEELCPGYCCN